MRCAEAACGSGVALMRAVGRDSVHSAVRAYIHARAIVAARGLDLQMTCGYQQIRIGERHDLVDAVLFYCFARRPDELIWEQAPYE